MRDVFRQSTERVDFLNGTFDVAGSMFAFIFYSALALWIA